MPNKLSDYFGEGWELRQPLHPEWLQNVSTVKVYVDGPMAAALLTRNIEPAIGLKGSNRRSQDYLIKGFAEAMLKGDWNFSHQGIALDRDGVVRDGAHRLKAIVLAAETDPDISIPFMVTFSLPTEAIRDIDVVRRRSLPDLLTMDGHGNTNVLSAVSRLIYLYRNAQFDKADFVHWDGSRPHRNALQAVIDERPEVFDKAVKVGLSQKLFTASAIAAMWIIANDADTGADMETWLRQVGHGENIGNGDPAFAVRRWMSNQRHDSNTVPTWEQLGYLLKAFRAYRTGQPMGIAVWKPRVEAFPRP